MKNTPFVGGALGGCPKRYQSRLVLFRPMSFPSRVLLKSERKPIDKPCWNRSPAAAESSPFRYCQNHFTEMDSCFFLWEIGSGNNLGQLKYIKSYRVTKRKLAFLWGSLCYYVSFDYLIDTTRKGNIPTTSYVLRFTTFFYRVLCIIIAR